MNKKLFFGMFAAATMLFATSCSNDEMDGLKGNESVVSFTLEQPGISTRAYSDGLSAERLSYAVFEVDANGTVATTPTYEDVIDVAFTNKQANITFALEKGKTYQFAFWADNAESPYKFDANTGKVTVDYTDVNGNNLLLSNDENRDAFFANDEVTIPEDGSSVIKTITLYRPFAQLNIGAIGNDAVGLENPTKSEVSIASGVYSTLNILTGEVDNEVAGGVTYALNTIPEDTEVFPVDGVDNYFSMNYLLVAKDKEIVKVGFTLQSESGNEKSRTFANIPVQRNHRTNIYGTIGNIISEAAEFTCIIDERYDEPNYFENFTGVRIGETEYQTLEEALTAAVEGNVIELGVGEYQLPAQLAKNKNYKRLVFEGVGTETVLYGRTTRWEGYDDHPSADQAPGVAAHNLDLVLKNLTYQTNGVGYTGGFAHAKSVSFEDCTIIGKFHAQSFAPHTFTNCTINTQDDYMFTYGADCTFDGCTFISPYGKALQVYDENGTSSKIVIEDCTFTASTQAAVSSNQWVTWNSEPIAAIEIRSILGKNFTVNITNSSATDYAAGLWAVKYAAAHSEPGKVTVTVDGTTVYDKVPNK